MSLFTLTKLRNETARTRLMVVMRERKNRTRILCQEISRDFLNGKTTSRSGSLDGIFFDERDQFFTRDPFPF
jgi:hypothetical protein